MCNSSLLVHLPLSFPLPPLSLSFSFCLSFCLFLSLPLSLPLPLSLFSLSLALIKYLSLSLYLSPLLFALILIFALFCVGIPCPCSLTDVSFQGTHTWIFHLLFYIIQLPSIHVGRHSDPSALHTYVLYVLVLHVCFFLHHLHVLTRLPRRFLCGF